jgi:glycerophosphoryl diester phosphodiesterase
MHRISLFLQTLALYSVHSINLQSGQCPLKLPSRLSTKSPTQLSKKRRPDLVTIAHRGASFSLPEHTLPAYRLALELGADYIEPDLVGTKDGRLVAVHDIDLNITTNIDEVYPRRNRTIEKNGEEFTGFFAFDFTLDELKSLRVKQRVDGRSRQFDWFYGIPTLHDILDLLYEWNNEILLHQNQTRKSGVYIELKSPEVYLHQQNVSLSDLFIEDINQHPHADEMFFNVGKKTIFGCESHDTYQVPPLVIQCFDGETLRHLRKGFVQKSMALPPFVLLVNRKKCHSSMFWYEVGRMNLLSGVGPDKECILGDGGYEFMIESKKLNLAVHPWVTRAETDFVTSEFDTAEEELRYLYCKRGISGIFTENVNLGVEAGFRGCDDYISAEELLEEDITEIEEQDGGRMNGTISKEICRQHSGGGPALRYFALMISGVAIGILGSFVFVQYGLHHSITVDETAKKTIQHGNMKGMKTLSTEDNESDIDMEII